MHVQRRGCAFAIFEVRACLCLCVWLHVSVCGSEILCVGVILGDVGVFLRAWSLAAGGVCKRATNGHIARLEVPVYKQFTFMFASVYPSHTLSAASNQPLLIYSIIYSVFIFYIFCPLLSQIVSFI